MTVELRTGELREPRPSDYMTKVTAVEPAPPGTDAPLWQSFLERVTDGDQELESYLQRVAGYCLTGSIEEHVLFFLHGTGANGKSVFVNTLLGIWKDYAASIGTDMLMVSKTDRHPTEVARLRGVRLAVGGEVEIGRTWAESKLKQLTGGDRLQARFMRQDFFEFEPRFKLMIVGNHRPSLRGVDEAIRRRLHLIPFTVTIPPAERDQKLPAKLRSEWPAILRWAIEGCLKWQDRGLDPPATVVEATDDYLEGEDAIGRWLDDCTVSDVNGWASSSELYSSWKDWAEAAGEYVISKKRLGQELEDRGFAQKRRGTDGTRGWRGLCLREPRLGAS